MRQTTLSVPLTEIGPSSGWVPIRLGEIWEYRELLYFLVWRDIKVRYKQTVLGAAWAVIQPFFTMIVFSIFFGTLARIPSDGVPYPIFAFAALLPWQLFANALSTAGGSLVAEQKLITKVYFPRLIVPTSAVLGGMADFAVAFLLLLAMMVFFGITPTWHIVVLPGLILLALATALAAGLWLAALNAQYRDFRYTIPFLTQFWLFLSPVAYPTSLVPQQYRLLYGLNPMAGVIDGFRWALLGTDNPPGAMLGVSAAIVALMLTSGLYYFRRTEKTFADIV
jgi:lipopolysaccharide transport system permease protein